jgi:hypothetical protein
MFAGHIGAGLAIAHTEPRVNVGVFVVSALLLDLLLWLFVFAGWESAAIPGNFAGTHQADFVFPYSHGLIATVAWSGLAAAASALACAPPGVSRLRVGALVAAAVFSHWLLDWLVHRPELPLAGPSSTKTGLGLWQHMPLALVIEACVCIAGLLLFLRGNLVPRGRSIAIAVICMLVMAFTIVGMTVAPPPPSVPALAGGSLASLVVVAVLLCWLGRPGATPSSLPAM